MPEKVIIVGTAHPFRGGGMSTFNERLALELSRQGYETEIVNFTTQYPNFLFPGKSQFTDEPAPSGIKISRLLSSINPLTWYKTASYIKKQKPSKVIFRYWMPFMAPCLGMVAKLIRSKKIEVIAITDNIIPHEKFPFSKPLTSFFLKQCDKFVCMSRSVLADLQAFKVNKPSIFIPHPLYDNFGDAIPKNEALEALKLDPNFQYLLFFGFIRKYKGLDLLLEAFADERLRKLPIKLLVAGEFYDEPAPYFDFIKQHNLSEHVVLHTDFIPNNLVATYFSAASLLAQTYHHATQSGVTQIAFHFDLPMLVTQVGGLDEFILHNESGYVCNPNSKEIADSILDYFENNRQESFQPKVMEMKVQFSWERFLQKMLK